MGNSSTSIRAPLRRATRNLIHKNSEIIICHADNHSRATYRDRNAVAKAQYCSHQMRHDDDVQQLLCAIVFFPLVYFPNTHPRLLSFRLCRRKFIRTAIRVRLSSLLSSFPSTDSCSFPPDSHATVYSPFCKHASSQRKNRFATAAPIKQLYLPSIAVHNARALCATTTCHDGR